MAVTATSNIPSVTRHRLFSIKPLPSSKVARHAVNAVASDPHRTPQRHPRSDYWRWRPRAAATWRRVHDQQTSTCLMSGDFVYAAKGCSNQRR